MERKDTKREMKGNTKTEDKKRSRIREKLGKWKRRKVKRRET